MTTENVEEVKTNMNRLKNTQVSATHQSLFDQICTHIEDKVQDVAMHQAIAEDNNKDKEIIDILDEPDYFADKLNEFFDSVIRVRWYKRAVASNALIDLTNANKDETSSIDMNYN